MAKKITMKKIKISKSFKDLQEKGYLETFRVIIEKDCPCLKSDLKEINKRLKFI